MYQKVLVPVDSSEDSHSIVKAVPGLVAEGGEAILFHVIPIGRTRTSGHFVVLGSQQEEDDRNRAMVYLNRLAHQLRDAPVNSRCVVVASNSVAECISNFARQEYVDLIAMYTHDRKGLAKLIRRSVAAAVQHKAQVEVRVFGPSEMAQLGAATVGVHAG